MAQNITLLGASYTAVPAVTLPKTGGGTAKFSDASVTTAVESDVAEGKIFLLADGTQATGTASGGSTSWETVYSGTVDVINAESGIYYGWIIPWSEPIEQNSVWKITWNGVAYECTATWEGSSDGNPYALGNYTLDGGQGGNNEPFMLQPYYGTQLIILAETSGSYAITIQKQVSGGDGSATLVTKTITANGTYSAEDDDADGYSEVTFNVPTGSSGLVFETGTYEPSADTAGEKILFANSHSEAPVFVHMVDATGTLHTVSNTNMEFMWYDFYKLYGIGMPWSTSAFRYATAFYAYRETNASALTYGAVNCTYNSDVQDASGINLPRFWVDELGFTPNSASTSRYWRTGRTYKWYAVWRNT